MTEKILKDYFEGTVTAEALSIDLVGTTETKGTIRTHNIEDFKSDSEFVVTTQHIIKLCDDVINQKIKLDDLRAIAFALEFSDYFTWDKDTKDGNLVGDVIFNWSSPEINTPTTMDYVKYCAYYLTTGEHR
ncbi:MAG TPA: hypothetical protein PLC65_12825 [Bacteroidia bacterium]|nr:hypothetical protein [Bacteroidia bacterium]